MSPETPASSPSGPPSRKGRLKIFFGMSPGVGKTYAMLENAQARRREGLDVVAGVVEAHGRQETEALLEGIEPLPPARLAYRGASFAEFDLDGMLLRSPQLALVDELAHSNIPGSRHPKRYQDVRELLDHGINVYTTLNVQHLESRADAVEALSGAQVRERVPDTVLEWADEIEVIDLSQEELRERLAEGKVYFGDQAVTAADAFFSEKNLSALREMALRSTAERVNLDLLRALKHEREARPLPTGERIMVAVGPSPYSNRLVRWTKRYAASLNASWVAVHVESPEPLPPDAEQRLHANLQLARTLGAEIVSTSGENVAESLLRMARRELVTQIVAGRSPASWLRRLTGGSLTDRLVSESGPIAVHVVPAESPPAKPRWKRLQETGVNRLRDYLLAVGGVGLLGLVSYPFRADIGYLSVALLYLALTILGGLFLGRSAVLALAVLSACAWNFFFVPPQFTFHINSGQDILLFCLLLLVAASMGQLTARLHALNLAERRRETRTYALYRFLDCLSRQAAPAETIDEALTHAREVTGCRVNLLLDGTQINGRDAFPDAVQLDSRESGVISWVVKNRDMAGASTQNLPEIPSLFLPVESGEKALGVLRVELETDVLSLASRDLLMQMARLLGRFLEREAMRSRLEEAQLLEASQRLQKTLLDTVSHELKTPLTVILGALEQIAPSLSEAPLQADLLQQAERSSRRLLRNVNMLLDLTRFESGTIRHRTEYVDLHDLVRRLRSELAEEFGDRAADIGFTLGVESFQSDEALLFQLLNQLLRNALSHTPTGTEIHCELKLADNDLSLVVRDNGPGLPDNPDSLFAPFSRGPQHRSKGLGLGLSIARRICENLGGSLTADNEPGGGARFSATLPPPTVSAQP
ncbi:sensor histidine kinase KdpD [Ruficoccus amylovorans]|uniref:histidine kinase n=1 Tax=Ruficoccus amylovorans TaxID=1804625 RepID=A0A842H9G9_9BACT|nr:ATP-binding protein [Ruficoccus amylovorans]MBC2592915.1 sensor histidine kinase KdpD [Ruficoccus amylovorans]